MGLLSRKEVRKELLQTGAYIDKVAVVAIAPLNKAILSGEKRLDGWCIEIRAFFGGKDVESRFTQALSTTTFVVVFVSNIHPTSGFVGKRSVKALF